jgi:hypothetical protein
MAVEIGTDTVIRYTDSPTGIDIGTDSYIPCFLEVGEVMLDDQPAVSVRIGNTDNVPLIRDLDGTAQGGLVGRSLKIYEQYEGGDYLTIYSGIVIGFTADAASVEIIGSLAELRDAGMVGMRTTRLCSYRYGGTRCGNTDATSCDHSYAACLLHSNAARYGGFRAMPTLNTRLQYYLQEFVPGSSRFGTGYSATPPMPSYNPFAPPPRTDIRPPRLLLKRVT